LKSTAPIYSSSLRFRLKEEEEEEEEEEIIYFKMKRS
jgi:hypothetical protein